MIGRKAVSASLTPELHAFLNELVAAGGYANASEAMRADLGLLRHEEAARRIHEPRRDSPRRGPGMGRRALVRDGHDARG
ncbi:type II toxin-antitoxin system ParD family antitoxin [Methylobacterium sp. J-059]|uniref:ribbon-helix-helix domain-containing protein n=1 Tax=Methylobacterium sp. J-059 TaxID=2836643 RepID=UPI003918732B